MSHQREVLGTDIEWVSRFLVIVPGAEMSMVPVYGTLARMVAAMETLRTGLVPMPRKPPKAIQRLVRSHVRRHGRPGPR